MSDIHVILTLPRSGSTKFNFCFAEAGPGKDSKGEDREIRVAHRALTCFDGTRFDTHSTDEKEDFGRRQVIILMLHLINLEH